MDQLVLFFLIDVTGGVASVISNIVQFANINKSNVNIIACRDKRDVRNTMIFPPAIAGIVKPFQHNSRRNFYYTVRRLKKTITAETATIVATDSLELEMMQLLRIDQKLIFIVMGDFDHYYGLAKKHSSIINGFIAISNEIFEHLQTLLPERKKDIHLAYFPTPVVNIPKSKKQEGVIKIIFAARLDKGKNPLLLFRADEILRKNGISVQWTIVGDGELANDCRQMAAESKNFSFTGTVSNLELHQLYLQHDIFIMPSKSEGLPVSLIEAMKTGLVPVISDIPGGVREIVKDGRNGLLCEFDNEKEFAASIEKLATDPIYYEDLAAHAKQTATGQFDPYKNSNHYFDLIKEIVFVKGQKQFIKFNYNKLDKPWFPNFLVQWVRSFRAD